MLSKDENETLTRVGPGTLMGNLMRRYWLPALLSSELPEADGPPVRVRLLCEDLVAFRDTSGKPGLFVQACPHRGASLFFGRNEEDGLRCVYHGWKFDVTGACVDMPSEPAESNFKNKVRVRSYPTHESGGLIWTYMGPAEKQGPFRDFGSDSVPRDRWRASKMLSYCNFVQSMEGNLDTAHISYLHRNFADREVADDGTDMPGYSSVQMSTRIRAQDRTPRVEVQDMSYGYRYAGIRTSPNGFDQARMSVYVLPVMTFVSALPVGGSCGIFVPIDDDTCWRYNVTMHASGGLSGGGPTRATRPVPSAPSRVPGLVERVVFADNDYLIDRDIQRDESYTGILGVVQQDLAITESMGTVYDRTSEHLGTTDKAIIRMREMLLKAATDLAAGIEPPALDPSYAYTGIRSAEKILAQGEDWRLLSTPADEMYVSLQAAATS